MAKQDGPVKLNGTISNITFYKSNGQYLARKKSSLNKKRFFKDDAFERSRKSCKRLGRGSQLASIVYRTLPKVKQVPALYSELRSLAVHLLKEERSEEEVLATLNKRLTRLQKRSKLLKKREKPRKPGLFTVLQLPKVWVGDGYISRLNEMLDEFNLNLEGLLQSYGEKMDRIQFNPSLSGQP